MGFTLLLIVAVAVALVLAGMERQQELLDLTAMRAQTQAAMERADAAEHALRIVADEFGCRVTIPPLMVSCLKEKGWKQRTKALSARAKWETWVAQERQYYRNLAREGLVPLIRHVRPDEQF